MLRKLSEVLQRRVICTYLRLLRYAALRKPCLNVLTLGLNRRLQRRLRILDQVGVDLDLPRSEQSQLQGLRIGTPIFYGPG